MKIRKANADDWEKMREVLKELVNEVPPVAIELESLIMKSKEWIASFPKQEQGYFIVAEVNDKLIGFCYLAVPKFYKPAAYIGIAIEKKYRRKEIGSQLFYYVAEWAKFQRLTYIIADIWSWNFKSLKFFEKIGFKEQTRFMDKFKGVDEEKIRLVKKI